MRLQRKLFLIISAVTIVPLLVLQFGVVDRNEKALEEQVRREVLGTLDKLGGELETLLNAHTTTVRGLAAVPAVEHFAEVIPVRGEPAEYRVRADELTRFFINYQAAVPSIQALRVLDTHGNTLVKVKEHKVIEPAARLKNGRGYVANHGQRYFFRQIAQHLPPGGVGISNFELGQIAPGADFCPSMLRYLTPLQGAGGERLGYLVVNIWGKRIDEVIATAIAGHGEEIMMAELSPSDRERDGVYLYHTENAKRFANQTGAAYRLSLDLGQDQWQAIAKGPLQGSIHRGEQILFYRRFHPYRDRDTQWLLAVSRQRSQFLAPVIEMRQTIWALMGIAALLSLGLARWSALYLARPVQQLAEIITRYANGERVRYGDRRLDEIGQVGRAYNYLIDTLDTAEQERARAETIACQAAKMATIGGLAAGVAHEINNPLNNMMGLTALMEQSLKENGDPVALLEDLEVLRQEERRCADIVQGLLDFGRPRPPSLERIDLVHLLGESIRLLARKSRASGVTMELHAPSDIPPVTGDGGQLQQVVVNLLLNAIQASPGDGEVHIYLETVGKDRIRCRVEDRGPGLDEAQIARIFEPFYTTKKDRQGTGLGLSVSYSIVQRHGGEMGAFPRKGGGLAVWFTIPRKQRNQRPWDPALPAPAISRVTVHG